MWALLLAWWQNSYAAVLKWVGIAFAVLLVWFNIKQSGYKFCSNTDRNSCCAKSNGNESLDNERVFINCCTNSFNPNK